MPPTITGIFYLWSIQYIFISCIPCDMDQIPKIYKALCEVQNSKIVLKKKWTVSIDLNNGKKKEYTHITLDELVEQYATILSKNNLVALHSTQWAKDDTSPTILTTNIVHTEDWSMVSTEYQINYKWSTPQVIGSQITYAKRYNLWQLLNIATEEDDDANIAESQAKKDNAKKGTPINTVSEKWPTALPIIQKNAIDNLIQKVKTFKEEDLDSEKIIDKLKGMYQITNWAEQDIMLIVNNEKKRRKEIDYIDPKMEYDAKAVQEVV